MNSSDTGGLTSTAFSYPVLQEFRKANVCQDLIAFKDVEMTATVGGHPEFLASEMLSGNAFRGLGVATLLGRAFTEADDESPVVMVRAAYWVERFGGETDVLGKTISLNGVPVTIIGVATNGFTGLTMGQVSKVFVPLTLQPLLMPRAQKIGSGAVSLLDNPKSWWVQVMGRLRSDVPEARAQAELDTVLRRTARATLPEAEGLDQFHLLLQPGARGIDYLRGYAQPSYVLMALAGLVLLLACVNLVNLLLAKATARQREFSTRLALGAGRSGIARQLLTESFLLAGLGGLAGVALAWTGRSAIPRLLADAGSGRSLTADFDWQVVLFGVVISLIAATSFGLVPMWQGMRFDLNAGLKEATHATMGRRKAWLGRGLVVTQIGLLTILLLAAGLFVRTLTNLAHVQLGFQADHLLLFKINPPRSRYDDQQMIALYRELEEKFASIAGVRSVTLSNIGLIGDGHSGAAFHATGQPVLRQEERVQANRVGAEFFQTMGIPLLQGRHFGRHDTAGSPKVAVVNRALAEKYFRGENPVGRTFDSDEVDGITQIIGIAADTRYGDLRTDTPPTFYVPYEQGNTASRMMTEIRTATDPYSVLGQLRTVVESIDRDLPLIDVRTEEEQVATTLSSERIFANLTSGFGLVALVLATVGIYGLMAYTVERRTAEIGIRMALGARVGQVLIGVLRETLWLSVAGLATGLGVALWLAKFIGTMLFGLAASDPVTLVLTVALLMAVAVLAGYGPARRAARIDPVRALRHE